MDEICGQTEARRRFLRMLVASPLFTGSHFLRGSLTNLLATNVPVEEKAVRLLDLFQQSDEAISSPDQAFDVMDFLSAVPERNCILSRGAMMNPKSSQNGKFSISPHQNPPRTAVSDNGRTELGLDYIVANCVSDQFAE